MGVEGVAGLLRLDDGGQSVLEVLRGVHVLLVLLLLLAGLGFAACLQGLGGLLAAFSASFFSIFCLLFSSFLLSFSIAIITTPTTVYPLREQERRSVQQQVPLASFSEQQKTTYLLQKKA